MRCPARLRFSTSGLATSNGSGYALWRWQTRLTVRRTISVPHCARCSPGRASDSGAVAVHLGGGVYLGGHRQRARAPQQFDGRRNSSAAGQKSVCSGASFNGACSRTRADLHFRCRGRRRCTHHWRAGRNGRGLRAGRAGRSIAGPLPVAKGLYAPRDAGAFLCRRGRAIEVFQSAVYFPPVSHADYENHQYAVLNPVNHLVVSHPNASLPVASN